MPADIFREKLVFLSQFLNFVLAEISDAEVVYALDHLPRMSLADSDKRDVGRIASGPFGSLLQATADSQSTCLSLVFKSLLYS